jgi:undecaprenyl phosphate N,N'-diacetylbacillosamine 1-phosphate transferase
MSVRAKLALLANDAIKRCADVGGALVVGSIFVAVGPALAAAIRADSPGPIFFACDRLGQWGRPMRIRKLRTMIHNAPEKFNADGSRLVEESDARVTRVGKVLRGGLDELPQVLNILRGELSFIGPRPDDLFAVDLYRDAEWLKLSVKPGITGLAQVNGRNDLPYHDRLKYDVYYALHRNLWLDARIALRTVLLALGARPAKPLVPLEVAEREARRDDVVALGLRLRDALAGGAAGAEASELAALEDQLRAAAARSAS